MHDADGVPSRRCVKNSTLLRSRVEFPRKTILFFHCLLDRGRFSSCGGRGFVCDRENNYLISISAPASVNAFASFSASSLERPSLRVVGAPSTASFASFRPRPSSARTTLITLSFCAPKPLRMTSNSVFSSTGSAAAAGPATATAVAAADTPNSSSTA